MGRIQIFNTTDSETLIPPPQSQKQKVIQVQVTPQMEIQRGANQ